MTETTKAPTQKVLIASANPLFAHGLESILRQRQSGINLDVQSASSMADTLKRLETWHPDLVIVDYDDQEIGREEFLNHFVSGDWPMQVMLVSLKASGAVVVYDRKTLTPAQAETWLGLSDQPKQDLNPGLTRRKGSMRHFIIVGVLVVVLTLVMNAILTVSNLLPVEASTQAISVDRLFSIHFLLISFLFSLITAFIGYSIVVFRSKPGDQQAGKFFKNNNRLEFIWMIVPLGTVMTLAFIGSQTLADVLRADPQAMQVKVLAYQWGWTFEYPASGITTNQLYLPVDKQVLFSMTSRDVIHSFWVPEFRIKQDILPGANLVKTLRITPSEIGNFKVRCAEMCGGSHAYMEAPVNVVSQADFDTWVSQQLAAANANPEDRGKAIAQTSGCVSCHSVDGKKSIGPTWKGLAGSTVQFADGSTALADDAFLKQYILNPDFKVIQGYPANVMPKTFGKTLTDQQISDILAYIKTLK